MADEKKEDVQEPLIDWSMEPAPAATNFVQVQHSSTGFAATFGDQWPRSRADAATGERLPLRIRPVSSLRWFPPDFFSAVATLASSWNVFVRSMGGKGPLFRLVNQEGLAQLDGVGDEGKEQEG